MLAPRGSIAAFVTQGGKWNKFSGSPAGYCVDIDTAQIVFKNEADQTQKSWPDPPQPPSDITPWDVDMTGHASGDPSGTQASGQRMGIPIAINKLPKQKESAFRRLKST
ncbi:MAG TPA: hypothetical protein VGF61_17655 [Candidatus Acidoferrum sp.]|jgi:hypothetical protein